MQDTVTFEAVPGLEYLQFARLAERQHEFEITVRTGGDRCVVATNSIAVQEEHRTRHRYRTQFIEHATGEACGGRVYEVYHTANSLSYCQRDGSRDGRGVVIREFSVLRSRNDCEVRSGRTIVGQAVEAIETAGIGDHAIQHVACCVLQHHFDACHTTIVRHADSTRDLAVRRTPTFRSSSVGRALAVAGVTGRHRVVVVHIGKSCAVEIIGVITTIERIRTGVTAFLDTRQYVTVHRFAIHLPAQQHAVLHRRRGIALRSREAGDGSRLVKIEIRTTDGLRLQLQ